MMITAELPVHPDITATEAEVINTHAKARSQSRQGGYILKVHLANILDIASSIYDHFVVVKNKSTLFCIRIAWRSKYHAEYLFKFDF